MKILLANKYFYRKGGAETIFFETAKILENKGHKIIFFSMKHPQNLFSEYEKYFISNVNYEKGGLKNEIDVSLKLLYSFEAKRKIEELIKKEKPDIAHLHNVYHQISPSILHAIKKFNIPVVLTLHDYKLVCGSYGMLANGKICEACRDGRYYYCFLKKCAKNSRAKSLLSTIEMYLHHKILHIYDLVDVFISPSNFLKEKLKQMGFKGKFVHIPNFVNIGDFKPQFDWQEYSITYFGRLSKSKGLFTLIDAVKGLDVKVKIIGDGPVRPSLELKVKEDGLRNVEFLGYKSGEDLRNEIKKTMFVVLPTESYENYPLSILEAFSLGKTAVGARIGGIPELVKDNETGLTFESGNAADLRAKIVKLLKEPAEIMRLAKNARKKVEDEVSLDLHYKKLMEIYDSVLNK